ncbi:anti-sigma factor [uncultured Actinomyces sp.]|uniref:anti-sigma factor n=1 Tax=uncultured Actinomyces sp. TaxID=249061 RepID=UPI002889F958|nr:anti-sigma factor [uncultured Actinomyces sp.]
MTDLERRRRPGEALGPVPAGGDRADSGALAGGGPAEDAPDEILARLGAALEPIDPPASLRSELLKRIAHEPQTGKPTGAVSPRSEPVAGAPVDPESAAAAATEGAPAETAAAELEARDGTVDDRPGAVVPLHPRRRRWSAIGLRVAAAAAILCVGIGVGRWTAMSSMAPTEHYAHLNQAQDVQRVTDTMPDGHIATLTWSRDMSMTALSLPEEMMDAARGGSLQVWLRKGETVSSLGLYDPQSGTGFTFLDLMPEAGEQIFITREPAGGSGQPTGEPLVAFDVHADGTTTRHSPTPTDGGTGTDT